MPFQFLRFRSSHKGRFSFQNESFHTFFFVGGRWMLLWTVKFHKLAMTWILILLFDCSTFGNPIHSLTFESNRFISDDCRSSEIIILYFAFVGDIVFKNFSLDQLPFDKLTFKSPLLFARILGDWGQYSFPMRHILKYFSIVLECFRQFEFGWICSHFYVIFSILQYTKVIIWKSFQNLFL